MAGPLIWEVEALPDRNYSVDDILREIRRKQSEEVPAGAEDDRFPGRPASPAPSGPEEARSARRERSAAGAQRPRPMWEEDEASEPSPRSGRLAEPRPQRSPAPPARPAWEALEDEEEPPRPRRSAKASSAWEALEREEAMPRSGRAMEQREERPQRAARAPARPVWEEMGEEDEPPRSSRAREREERPQRSAKAPARPVWEEMGEEDEPPRPSRTRERAERPQRSAKAPARPMWEEPEEDESPRPGRSARTASPARSQGGQAPSLWEGETPLPGGQVSARERERDRSINATAAAQLITGVSAPETDLEKRVVQQARGAARAEEAQEERRPRRPREDEEDRPRSRRREQDEEEPRPRRRGQREEEEPRRREAEEDDPRSRPRIGAQLRGMQTSLIIRLVVNLLCAAGLIYLMLAPDQGWPIPEYFMDQPEQYLWLEVALLAFSALLSGSTVGGGMISLFCLRPNNDCYSAIGVFACLVQGSYMAMRPEMMDGYAANLYLPMGALLLLFNTIGKLILRGRVAGSYRLIAQDGAKHTAAVIENENLAGRIGGDVIDGEPEIAYFTRSAGVSAFLEQAFSESKAEDVSKVIAPMTAVAALIMAVISYPFHKDVFTSACVFTAALCITAPVAGVIAANLPIALANRKLGRWGTTLCGYSAVDQFAGVNQVLLRGYDLFPPESVTLHTIKPFNRTPMDQVVIDIASVLSQCGSTLTQLFASMVSNPGLLREAESFACEDGKGVSAWVEGRRVLIGTRELMKSYGVAIPPKEYEDQYGQGKQILYISNSGQAAAMCVLSYKADKQMRRALEVLADRDIAVCVYTTDPNVTAERVSQTYAFPRELVKVIPAALHREVDRYLDPNAKARAGMVHNGTPSSYIRGVAAARSCDNALTVETALLLLSVVVGFALVTFFAFTGGMPALTWVTIAAYQAFWAFIELLVAFIKSN